MLAACTFWLGCAVAVIVGVHAQTKPATPQEQGPVIRSDANFVRVDVYPLIDGKPVMDLLAADFEVFEDGVAQTVQSFEHIVIRPAGPQALLSEPGSTEASAQAAANPRNRVFVIFLDVPHVGMHGAWTLREPLIRMLDRILGPDDLVGVMTPAMSASQLVLARKRDVIAGGLRDLWPWGERHTLARDQQENQYETCFGYAPDVVAEMIARRRERITLESLSELVHHLGGIREDRKAILTMSEGWALYRPNPDLNRLRVIDPVTGTTERVPGRPPIGVGPDGRLTMESSRNVANVSVTECDSDRMQLASQDNELYFRTILDDANRMNASFYTVDPRGLAAADAPIGPAPPPPVAIDQRNLESRLDTLRTLANNTDGMAVLNSNDLDAGLKRISDDLTSYYLLGYTSTNGKLDGRFRTLKVRVKRPGVEVRARRGYRAPTEEEVRTARAGAAAPVAEPVAAVTSAISDLARLRAETPFRIHVVIPAAAVGGSALWVAGELRQAGATSGGQVDISVTGGATGTSSITLAAGQRSFLVSVPLNGPPAGTIGVRARLSGTSVVPLSDNVSIDASGTPRALLFRRGPSTGNRVQPAGDPQFSRTERVHLELPVAPGVSAGDGRVLDRSGKPLAVPVVMGQRTDEGTGLRWITADVTLSPLTLGDYAIEMGLTFDGKKERIVTAFRVGR
jgi:VWFA-related protein